MAAESYRSIFQSRITAARMSISDTRREINDIHGPDGERLLSGEARRQLEEMEKDIRAFLDDGKGA